MNLCLAVGGNKEWVCGVYVVSKGPETSSCQILSVQTVWGVLGAGSKENTHAPLTVSTHALFNLLHIKNIFI